MILVFIGYTLIYAAVANRGRFATDPWGALLADAYDTTPGTPSAVSPLPPTTSPTVDPTAPAATRPVITRNIIAPF